MSKEQMHIRITTELKEKVAVYAESLGVSQNTAIALLVAEGLQSVSARKTS